MKKSLAMLTALITLTSAMTSTVSAVDVYLDGSRVPFEEYSNIMPYISYDRTLVPIRPVFEKLGWTVSWNDNTKVASMENKEQAEQTYGNLVDTSKLIEIDFDGSISNAIKYTVTDQYQIYTDYVVIDTLPEIKEGMSMLPLRAICELIGKQVVWNEENQTVYLQDGTPDDTYPSISTVGEFGIEGLRELLNVKDENAIIGMYMYPDDTQKGKGIEVRFSDNAGGFKTATVWENYGSPAITNIGHYMNEDIVNSEVDMSKYTEYDYVERRICLSCGHDWIEAMTASEYDKWSGSGERITCPECNYINAKYLILKNNGKEVSGTWAEDDWD